MDAELVAALRVLTDRGYLPYTVPLARQRIALIVLPPDATFRDLNSIEYIMRLLERSYSEPETPGSGAAGGE